MLTFLRKIRKTLIESGFAQKYFIYAIGEIALVVIGILIALQINNWSENKKSTQKVNDILLEIRRDIENNIDQSHVENEIENRVIRSALIVLNNLDHIKEYHDSMDYHFMQSHHWGTASWKSSGYETLKSVGLDLIDSDSLKEAIVDLYEISYSEVAEVMRTSEGYSANMTAPILTDLFRPSNSLQITATPIDYEMVVRSDKYKNVISYWTGLRYFAIGKREKAIENGRKVIRLIDLVLE